MPELTSDQLQAAGIAARALLTYSVAMRDRLAGTIRLPVQAVCRTAESDLAASRAALEPLVTTEHLEVHGYEDLWFLAADVPKLAHLMPDLVGALYVNAFNHAEETADVTAMGTSRILALRSTRRQDYETGLYVLGERFETFLRTAPREAIKGLDAALAASARAWKYDVGSPSSEFSFAGVQVTLREDHARFWDDGVSSPEAQGTMLRALDKIADELAGWKDRPRRTAFLRDAADVGRSGTFWSRLLRIGARHPTTWGKDLSELAAQPSLLLSWDTTEAVGRFTAAAFPSLNAAARGAIERAVVTLPDRVGPEDAPRARAIRDRILAGLDPDRLGLAVARRERATAVGVAEAKAASLVAPSSSDDADFLLADEFDLGDDGVPGAWTIESDAVMPVRDRDAAAPAPEERLAQIERAFDLVSSPGIDRSVDAEDEAWARIAVAAAQFLVDNPASSSGQLDRLEVIVRAAVGHRLPVADPGDGSSFTSAPHWSIADVRTHATIALMGLVLAGRTYPEVGRLAADPVAAVRYQVLSRVAFLMTPDRALALELAKRAADDEADAGVIAGLMHSVAFLLHVVPDEATSMLECLLDRFPDDHEPRGVRASAAGLLAALSVSLNHVRATEVLDGFVDDSPAHMEELEAITRALRTTLALGAVPGSDPDAERRARAIARLRAVVRAARRRMEEIAARPAIVPGMPWPEAESIEWQKCARIASEVAQEVYFGSLAYDANKNRGSDGGVPQDRMARFYREGRDLLAEIATIGWPQATHHLIDTLRAFVWVDPMGVLELAVQAIRSGREGGFEYESLAVAQVVTLVEDYLTNYRGELLASDGAVDQLVEILDGFVRIGWEPAVRLTYRLGDIYR